MSDAVCPRSRTAWHIASWPLLAWLETAIKLVAIVLGTMAFVEARFGGVMWQAGMAAVWRPDYARLAQWIILFILSLGLLVAILDRVREREVVAMLLVILKNLGHWGMVFALASKPGPGGLLVGFAGLMLLGDLVKLVSPRLHDFAVCDAPRAVPYDLTLIYVVGYAAILILELLG